MALWNQRLHIYAHTRKVIGSMSVLIWSSFVFLHDYNKYSKNVIKKYDSDNPLSSGLQGWKQHCAQ